MPIIDGRIHPINRVDTRGLAAAITTRVISALQDGFARQLGFVDPEVKPIAERVIGRLAPGWVWVSLDDFRGYIAGNPPGPGDVVGRFNISILGGALDDEYMQGVVNAVAAAAHEYLRERHGTPDLAVTNVGGNVRMSVPGHPDVLLTPQGVHELLVGEIVAELRRPAGGSPAPGRSLITNLTTAGMLRLR